MHPPFDTLRLFRHGDGWTTSLSHFPDTGHDGVDETVPGMEDTKHAYDRAHRMAKVKGELHKYANNYQLPEE